MCDECGRVCWVGPEMTEEEQAELEAHIERLIREQSKGEE